MRIPAVQRAENHVAIPISNQKKMLPRDEVTSFSIIQVLISRFSDSPWGTSPFAF